MQPLIKMRQLFQHRESRSARSIDGKVRLLGEHLERRDMISVLVCNKKSRDVSGAEADLTHGADDLPR